MSRICTAGHLLVWAALGGCGPSGPGPTGQDATGSSSATTSTGPLTGSASSQTSNQTSSSSTSTDPTSTGPTTTGASGSTGGACRPDALTCSGKVFECSDGLDNDNDGRVDLDDPECLGPCDHDEGAFRKNLFHRFYTCKLDCQFDANTGQGDDKCDWDLRCDPLDPGASVGCPTDPGLAICSEPTTAACVAFCEPRTPNGCDCLGCCQIGGAGDWYAIGVGDACSANDPSGCLPCTPRMDECGNPCEVDQCEICLGQSEPPAGCTAPGCVGGTPCTETCDCPDGDYCLTGCCVPIPE